VLRERAGFKQDPGQTFTAYPGDIKVLALMFETIIKLATTITVAQYYGPNEDLGVSHYLAAFAGHAVGLARTALADTTPSDGVAFQLHGALLVLLRAYLPFSAAKLWRDACDDFVFPTGFSQGWTELVRLFDLQCVIAELKRESVVYWYSI
jgi:hypothetical protein